MSDELLTEVPLQFKEYFENLPTLDNTQVDQATDFVMIQKADGTVAKMLITEFKLL